MGTSRRILLTLLVVGLLGGVAVVGTLSAFSSTTTNTDNSFTAGTVTLTDNDSGAVLYSVSNQKPGVNTVKCIKLTYSGSLDADVKLYTPSTVNASAQYINLTIEKGTSDTSTFPNCGTFTSRVDGLQRHAGELRLHEELLRQRHPRLPRSADRLGAERHPGLPLHPQRPGRQRRPGRLVRAAHLHLGGSQPVAPRWGGPRIRRGPGGRQTAMRRPAGRRGPSPGFEGRKGTVVTLACETGAGSSRRRPGGCPGRSEVCARDPWAESYTAATYGAGQRRRQQLAAARERRPGAASQAAPPAAAAPRPAASSPRRPAARRRRPRRAIRVLLALPAAFGLTLLLAISLPMLFGCRSLVVMSGSMEPGIATGSVVVVKRIPAAEIAVGDVVSFHSPESGRILTHRVQAVAVGEGVIEVQTRGDANTGTESWAIEPTGTVGRLVFEIPYLGYALAPLQGVAPRLLLVVMPALALGGILLASIWRDPAGSAAEAAWAAVAGPEGPAPGRE